MYTRLSQVMTKSYYREILEKALKQAKEEYKISPDISFNRSIYNQLVDIKKVVVEEGYIFTLEESKQKYPLGVMTIRNFDGYEDFDYKDMLIDISYGISRYPTMPEE